MARRAVGKIIFSLLAGVCCSELAAQSPKDTHRSANAQTSVAKTYGRLPLSFEPNQGQAEGRVKFLSRGQGYTLFLSRAEATLALQRGESGKSGTEVEGIGIKLRGANPQADIVGVDELTGYVSYFIGNDARHWIKNVPTYAKAQYQEIYPGIDLLFYGNEQQLESDFVIAAGGNPNQIRLEFEGGRGIRVSSEGDLILKTSNGEVRLLRPHVYQDVAGSRRDVSGSYVLRGARTVSFSVGAYDHVAPLVIDPVLVYSTALNGANFAVGNGGGHGIAVDAAGNAYVTGYTDRSNFLPTPGAFTTANGRLFVTKINPAGTGVLYTAVFGGTGSDVAMAIALDAQDEPAIAGFTSSADFPTMNPIQATLPAGTHAFVTKLNAAGSGVLYSTLLGGSGATGVGNGMDLANAVATDANGAVYLTGYTNSVDFPTKNGVQPTCPDLQSNGYCNVQGFVAKLDPTQSGTSAIIYSTYLGGKFPTAGQGIAVDGSGNAYITGSTNATDFATTPGAFQTTLVGGSDAFVSVLNPGGSSFVYSTFLGYGQGWGIAVDGQGNAYVTGDTNSFGGSFPVTAGAFQTTLGGSTTSSHAFVTKLNPSGSGLVYSTFLGGSGTENTNTGNIAIDANGNAYISGLTSSTDFPTTANAIQAAFGGPPSDAFVTELNASGSGLIYSTYLGGTAGDQAYGLALDAAGSIYVMGTTSSANFPTTPGAFEPTVNTGTGSAFVARIGAPLTNITLSPSANPSVFGQPVSFTATVGSTAPSALTPTGTVTFSDQGTILGTTTLSSGTAIFNTASLAVGSHSIIAAYAGDNNFAPSTSIALTQVVSQAGTTTTVSASPSPSILGQPVMLTANVGGVAPGAGTPTGTVTFLDGATVLGAGTLNSAGISTLSTSSLSSGSHSLTASYGGDTNFAASTSTPVTLTVQSSAPPPTGSVFVAVNSGGPHIEQYTTAGALQRTISGGPASNSYSGLAFGADGYLYVANSFLCPSGIFSCNELEKFDPVAGTWVSSAGSITPNTNPYSGVSNNGVSLNGLAIGPSSNLYVTTNQLGLYAIDPVANTTTPIMTADCCTYGVAFLPDGTPLSIISSQNAIKNDLTGVAFSSGLFTSAQALAFGPDRRLYILQYHEIDTVPVTGGAFTLLTASNAVSRGSFMTFDSQGHIWVTDINFGVLEFDSVTGQQINSFGSNTASGFQGIAIAPLNAPATHLAVSAPASATAGTPFNVTVTALDASNNPATSYTGTVILTSTDVQSVLPSNYTFTAADHGTHVFSVVTLNTPGSQTITATDTANAAITGTSAPISVAVPLTATHFRVSAPPSATAGAAFSVTVNALNAANQTSTNYTGTATLSSTDTQAALPAPYTFTAADHGTHVFSVTLNTVGSQTITATDNTTNAAITGTSAPISVTSAVPPPAQITDNETIKVSDAESFADAFDAEAVHVADAAFVTPLIAVTAPVAEFSAGGLGFGGQSGTQTITVSDIGVAPLTLASVTISGSSQFSIGQISCSSGATSLSTQLPAGGVCSVMINYAALAMPAQDIASLIFNDNAALSNLLTTPSGTSYTQSVPLNGAGANITPPPPPPGTVSVMDNETIHVADAESFPDLFDSETITVSDQVTIKIVSNPTTTSISAPGVTYGTAATATISVSALSGTVTGNVTLSVDGGAPSSISLSNGSAAFNLGILKAGSHSLSANFATQGSFSGSSAQATLVVNQAIPTISWANPAPIVFGTALSSTQLNATASVPGSFVYSPAAGSVLPAGVQTLSVTFTPTDTTDFTTATASLTLIVDAPPVFTSASATAFTVGTASSFTVTATGVPAPALSYSSLPAGVIFNSVTGVLSGTPAPGTGGAYSITFSASNSVGVAYQTFTLTVNEAPTITSNSTVTFVVGIARAFSPTATGFPAPTFAESGPLPQGLSFALNVLSGTAVEGTEGTYNISFTANNGVGSATTQKVTLVVIPQSLPAFTSPSSATFGFACNSSSTCTNIINVLHNSFTVTATGNPTPKLTAGHLPAGLTFTDNGNGTATLSGSPAPAVYHLTFTATGAGGAAFAATQSFTLAVIPVFTPPAFTSPSQAPFAVGQANTFTVAAAPFIDRITMSSASTNPLPFWLVLTDNHDGTATLSGIPQAEVPGQVHKITFTASNSGDPNYKVTQTFSLVFLP